MNTWIPFGKAYFSSEFIKINPIEKVTTSWLSFYDERFLYVLLVVINNFIKNKVLKLNEKFAKTNIYFEFDKVGGLGTYTYIKLK